MKFDPAAQLRAVTVVQHDQVAAKKLSPSDVFAVKLQLGQLFFFLYLKTRIINTSSTGCIAQANTLESNADITFLLIVIGPSVNFQL